MAVTFLTNKDKEDLQKQIDELDGTGTGKDGVSPTVTVAETTDGHEVTITDVNGDHTFTVLNGEKGDPGPVNIVQEAGGSEDLVMSQKAVTDLVAEAIKSTVEYETVDSVDEMVDTTKSYVLSSTGTVWTYGETFVDDTDRNLYDAETVKINVNPDGTARAGAFVTDYILVDIEYASPYNVRIVGLDETNGELPDLYKIAYYDVDKTQLGIEYANTIAKTKIGDRDYEYEIGRKIDIGALSYFNNITYVRLLCRASVSTSITESDVPTDIRITTPEPKTVIKLDWYDTKLTPENADGGNNYVDLLVKVNQNTADIAEVSDRITAIEKNSGSENDVATIPDYWKNAVDTVIDEVKSRQDASGKDVVNFVWFSDFHYGGSTDYIGNVGNLCSYVMDACDIPLALMNGDTLTAGVLPNDTAVLDMLDYAMELYGPIGIDRLMLVRGNHDDVYGSYSNGDTTNSYVNKVAPSKIWNKLHRPQANDFRRVFGGDGTYFYVDNIPQKTRFVCLNTNFYDGEAITNGTESAMTFAFGSTQLDWLESTALHVDNDWSVVIAMHVPPISDYATTFDETDYTGFRSIINASTADIVGIFCGHQHKDRVIASDLSCPVCVITCAINTPYDGTAADRVAGTTTETAIDIVSIDKANRKIFTTRLGIGDNREIKY